MVVLGGWLDLMIFSNLWFYDLIPARSPVKNFFNQELECFPSSHSLDKISCRQWLGYINTGTLHASSRWISSYLAYTFKVAMWKLLVLIFQAPTQTHTHLQISFMPAFHEYFCEWNLNAANIHRKKTEVVIVTVWVNCDTKANFS